MVNNISFKAGLGWPFLMPIFKERCENLKTTEELKLIDIDKLIPYANNARTHNKEQINKLRSSLREFGFVNPVLIDKEKNIIAGHGRVMAAREEGIKKVPCVLVEHLTDAQKKAYILADNRLAMDAGWDDEILALELENLKELDFDIDLTGFDAAEIDELFSNIHDKDVQDDDFDVDAALEDEPISKQGDIWLLGRHRLICGDSTKAETYEKLMEGKKANLCVTDPPYSVNYSSKAGSIKNDNLNDQDFYNFLLAAFKNIENAMADDASIYVFHADTEGYNFRKAFKEAGFYLSGVCIWAKQSLVLGRSPYQWQHEPILFGWRKDGRHKWYSDRKQTTIWNFDRPTKSELHPTMKPVPLLAYPIKNSSVTNCIVLDPFGGSGSTLIACEQTGRICYAIELDEKYADVIVKRYIEYVNSYEEVFLIRDGEKIKYKDTI
nr:site-specific DNA-methyltransferase [Tepidanaerobacter sp. EBM-38]